jgi:hypothetical protein
MNLTFREDRLIETAERLCQRIQDRFPHSSLAGVAGSVVEVAREAVVRAESIRRPNVWLRAGLVVLGLVALAGLASELSSSESRARAWRQLLDFLDATKGGVAVLGAAALFLVTLEVRLKRRRALEAIHELRGLAHIIDMHQLAKEPDRLGSPDGAPGKAALSAGGMIRYLNFCTELLALVSKVGQLYVHGFPDPPSLAAVDQLENMATGLSGKIWQKIMILDRLRTATVESPAPVVEACSPAPPVETSAPGGH